MKRKSKASTSKNLINIKISICYNKEKRKLNEFM